MPSRIRSQTLLARGTKFNFVALSVARAEAHKTLRREVVRHPGAVVIVPVLSSRGGPRIVLVRNFRIAVGKHLLECCAGTIERRRVASGSFGRGESPRACATRELVEETGYRAGKLRPLGWFYTSPGLSDEKMHAFLATDLTQVGQELEEDETIEVVSVPISRVRQFIRSGAIRDAKSIVALLLAAHARWGKAV